MEKVQAGMLKWLGDPTHAAGMGTMGERSCAEVYPDGKPNTHTGGHTAVAQGSGSARLYPVAIVNLNRGDVSN